MPTGVICCAGSIGGLSLDGSGLRFVLVWADGTTGIATGVGTGYRDLGRAEIVGGAVTAELAGLTVGTLSGEGDGTTGTWGVGWIVTGDEIGGATMGVGGGVTTTVGGWLFLPQAVRTTVANK